MKQKDILSITLINGFLLLGLAGFLASCQKKEVETKGMFTHYTIKPAQRSIASIKGKSFQYKLKNLNSFQDTKQIYVYCSLNSLNAESCYKKHFQTALNHYIKRFGPFKEGEISLLKQDTDFQTVKNKVHMISEHILSQLGPKLNQVVNKREQFCKENSKFYLKRCLNQYIEKDSFRVLNAYQKSFRKMNGPEYLYLQKQISKTFKKRLSKSFTKLKSI